MRATRVLMSVAAAITATTVTVATGSDIKNGQGAVDKSMSDERVANVSEHNGYARGGNGLEKDKYELSAQAERDVLSPGEQVVLNLTLRNYDSDEIYVIVGSPIGNRIEVKDGRGTKVPLSQKGARLLDNGGGGKWVYKKIEPGKKVSYQIYVHDFYDLPAGGTYTLSVQRDILMKDKKKRLKVKSNPVTIKIENS